MGLLRYTKHRCPHQLGLLSRVGQQYRLFAFNLVFRTPPVNEITRLVGLWPAFCIAVDIGQNRCCNAVPQVCNCFTEWLQLVIGLPFGELKRADFELGLPNAFA